MKEVILATIFAITVFFGICIGVFILNYYVFKGYKVRVSYSGIQELYKGRAACVRVSSVGAATKVVIKKPFLWCSVLNDRTYVSSNIIVEPTGDKE